VVFQILYSVVSVVLLMNLLIALINSTYNSIYNNVTESYRLLKVEWYCLLRFNVVPPPFDILQVFAFVYVTCCGSMVDYNSEDPIDLLNPKINPNTKHELFADLLAQYFKTEAKDDENRSYADLLSYNTKNDKGHTETQRKNVMLELTNRLPVLEKGNAGKKGKKGKEEGKEGKEGKEEQKTEMESKEGKLEGKSPRKKTKAPTNPDGEIDDVHYELYKTPSKKH